MGCCFLFFFAEQAFLPVHWEMKVGEMVSARPTSAAGAQMSSNRKSRGEVGLRLQVHEGGSSQAHNARAPLNSSAPFSFQPPAANKKQAEPSGPECTVRGRDRGEKSQGV